jgi:hypothetical protein
MKQLSREKSVGSQAVSSVDAGPTGSPSDVTMSRGPWPWPTQIPSLVLVINDTKLLIPCVKWFKLDISNTCDEGACGME